MTGPKWQWLAVGYLLLCLVLGGASAAGALANAILQIVALSLILAVLWRPGHPALPGEAVGLLWIVSLFFSLALLSVVPMPKEVWTALPLRDQIASTFALVGTAVPALPLSLDPYATIASLLWLLPPVAMFLLVRQLDAEQRRELPLALVAFAGVAIALSAFQLLGGESSPLRFYQITNPTRPVGFFANSNHQVTLILCALVFVGTVAARSSSQRSGSRRSGGAVAAAAIGVFLAVGVGISGSSAGYGLFPVAAVGAVLIYRRAVAGKIDRIWAGGLAVLLLGFGALALGGPLSRESLSQELVEQPSSRRVLATVTMKAIGESFPAGTGLGTFSTVYRRFENPSEADRQYANHAHNDYLEFVLELGVSGVLLILAFIIWWLRNSYRVWRRDFQSAALARAASITIGIILLHSIVDYPGRTSAIAAVLAMCCALLVPPPERRRHSNKPENAAPGEVVKHLEAN